MSPEQFRGDPVIDERSDQFSFCAALYEALLQKLPFQGHTVAEQAANVIAGHLLPPPLDSPVPLGVRSALLRGLATEPAARFPSMRELLDELAAGAHQESPLARAACRRGTVLGVAVAILVPCLIVSKIVHQTVVMKDLVLIGAAITGVYGTLIFAFRG